jgi:hypothetical protein
MNKMTSNREQDNKASRASSLVQCARGALSVFSVIAVGACSTHPTSAPQAREAVANLDQGMTAPSARQTGLGLTRLKRRVRVLEHGIDPSASSASEGRVAPSADGRGSALRVALERALIESGRYEVVKATAATDSGSDAGALHMSVELLDDEHVTTVRLHIRDPRASAMVFSGEGVTLHHRAGVFNRGKAVSARTSALNFAVGQALRSASAVLGALPWQAPVLKATDDDTLLIPGGKRLGLKPGVLLSIQTRERVLGRPGTRAQVAVASRLVGEVLIVDNLDDPERESMAVGTLVSGSLKGYDVRELIVRFCQPKGYFGHDFGHDHQCSAKAAALVSFDPDTALLSFSPELIEDEAVLAVPHIQPALAPPSAVF